MSLRIIACGLSAIVIISATAPGAHAQSFTSVNRNEPPTLVTSSFPTAATTVGGAYWKGTTTTTYADGKIATSNYTCVGWLTPGGESTNRAVCDAADPDGSKWSTVIDCVAVDIMDPTKPAECWGTLTGVSGKYAGRSGGFVQHGTTAESTSQGAWN